MGEVVDVNIYPLKGAQPATVDGSRPRSLEVRPPGLAVVGDDFAYGDREFFVAAKEDGHWAVVTPRGWRADSQKVAYDEDRYLAAVGTDIHTSDGSLELFYPGHSLRLEPYDEGSGTEPYDLPWVSVKLHGGTVMGVDMGQEAADFISLVVGRKARIMRNPPWARRILRGGEVSGARAADGYPFLVTVTGSLMALNRKNNTNTSMRSYRPNIEINLGRVEIDHQGLLPEDWAAVFEAGDQLLEVAGACGRCVVTNPELGYRVGDGLPAIRSRYGIKLDAKGRPRPGTESKFFGVGAKLNSQPIGRTALGVGDRARIARVSQHPHVRLDRTGSK